MKTGKIFLISSMMFVGGMLFSQYSCSNAIALSDGYTSAIISSPGTSISSTESWVSTASTDGQTSTTGFTYPDVYTFKYTTGASAGESIYFTIECDYATDGEHSIGVWTGCTGSTLSSCIVSTYEFDNVVGVCAQNLNANTTYYIGVGKEWASSSNTSSGIASRKLKFKVIDFTVETAQTIPSNECNTASAINIADPYSGSTRCNYTASSGSPSGCGSIENDSWMKFTAGSTTAVIDYEVYNCTMGYGVQLSIFSGSCNSLTLIAGSCVNYATNNAGGTWTLNGLTIGQTYYVRADGYAGDLCSYSFEPVSGVAILPIELVDFKVEPLSSGYNRITWQTASEKNSDYFVVEKSIDGKIFTSVSTTKGKGNSNQLNNYYEIDKNEHELTYYRLKSVDLNGSFQYSQVLSVKNTNMDDVSIFPNPSKTGKFIVRGASKNSMQQVEILNQQGLLVHSIFPGAGEKLEIDLAEWENGIYLMRVISDNQVKTYKLIKQ